MNEKLTSIFGPNWRSSISGIGAALTASLTVVAGLPYELGEVATILPPTWKAKVTVYSAIATFILRVLNSHYTKDKNVAGNNDDKVTEGVVATKTNV